ncbi:GtrA family protein [Arthrobacter sp. Sa2BUA2]|uniref:GtrA family protein n=1 Tax=Arthrobacter pullicola TaxID=2762224 RepID=A0ABR8YEY4_9MICC|nr:GtrA family protein [Arthrobacter pullicola]MBD8042787.1 GtrA family protein [Arthrobacter pullicola]
MNGISTSRKVLRRLGSFSLVGTVAFLVDIGLFNLLSATVLQDSPITAKVVSVTVATTISWLGSRYLTFRRTRGRSVKAETFLFALTNLVGLAIATGCLYVSHYLLGFDSQFADNVSGNVIGVLIGNVFRYFAYRYVVFTEPKEQRSEDRQPDDLQQQDA